MKKVISVRFKENGKSYYFDPGDAVIHTGEYVIVETARGVECGEVVQGVRELADAAVPKALKPITRMADSVDIRRMRQNREDEKRAYHTCQECIARHGLEMKLVEAEYTLDRSKIMFYFTADGRVDFRELVKDLAAIFQAQRDMGLKTGMLVTNPIPQQYAMDKAVIDKAIDQALAESHEQGIHGKETTPFLLARVAELTGGDSLESNIQLVLNNARVAAKTAVALCK